MKKQLIQRIGAICTGAVLTLGNAGLLGGSLPTVSAADDNYARLLQYSLYFYDANMCGSDVQSKGGMEWRGNCHTTDEVTGGFHDAGDHAMFGLPQGFTATSLGLSYYEFKDAYEATGQADHIKMILNHFCTFFRNSTKLSGDSVSNFLYQKGDGKEDHSYWGRPEDQGGRKMFWTSSGASDIAANYAAALALNYKNFGNEDDLKYAKALYKFSKQYNQCASDGPSGFYDSKKCADEQAMAAGCLALATGEEQYKNDVKAVNDLGVWWAYGWNDANLGAAVMNGIVNRDWSAANSYLSGKCSGGGYLFMDKWGSARLNCGMQFMALVATKEKQGDYIAWSKGQMNYILGENPANTCFVTGYASNSAKNAHHRAASGYTSYEQFNMNGWDPDGDHMNPFCAYGANAKPLIGALVGGPCTANGDYHDNMADYVCNEVAIDYNAGLVGAAAGLYYFNNSGKTDSTINGVSKIYSGGSSQVTTTTPITTTTTSTTTTTYSPGSSTTPSSNTTTTTVSTVTTGNPSGKAGEYEIKVGKKYSYDEIQALPDNERMIAFPYEDFGLTAASKEKITKVEIKLSANNGNVGTYVGAFGSSTSEAPSYWTMSDEITQSINGSSGTVTWTVPSATASIIQYGYGGELKFGVWWIDCKDFTIDSVKIYTDGTATTTTASTATTTKTTTTTTTTTSTTTTTPTTTTTTTTTTGTRTTTNPQPTKRGDVNCDGVVNVKDAVALARYVGNDGIVLTNSGLVNAECDRQSGISSNDLTELLKYLAGLITDSEFNA